MGVELTAVNLVALGVASVVAGFAAGLTSFGRGVLFHTSWLLASVLVGIQGNVTDAVSILAFQAVAVFGMLAFMTRKHINTAYFMLLWPASVVGMLAGSAILVAADPGAIQLGLSIVVLFCAVWRWAASIRAAKHATAAARTNAASPVLATGEGSGEAASDAAGAAVGIAIHRVVSMASTAVSASDVGSTGSDGDSAAGPVPSTASDGGVVEVAVQRDSDVVVHGVVEDAGLRQSEEGAAACVDVDGVAVGGTAQAEHVQPVGLAAATVPTVLAATIATTATNVEGTTLSGSITAPTATATATTATIVEDTTLSGSITAPTAIATATTATNVEDTTLPTTLPMPTPAPAPTPALAPSSSITRRPSFWQRSHRRLINDAPTRGIAIGALLAGFCSGLSAGMLGVPGPPLMVFISITGLDKSLILATVATVNLATAAPQAAILAARGVVALSDWPLFLVCIGAALIGMTLGKRLHEHLTTAAVQRIILALLSLAGSLLFGAGDAMRTGVAAAGLAAAVGAMWAAFTLHRRCTRRQQSHDTITANIKAASIAV